MAQKERRKRLYREPTFAALSELFEKEKRPQRVANVIARMKENESNKPEGQGRLEPIVQSSVSRALKALVEDGQVIHVDTCYMPNNFEAMQTMTRERIISEVTFKRPVICRMSTSTLLLDVDSASMDLAKRLFRDYLGKELCFDVLEFNGYLMLLMVFEMESKEDTNKKKARLEKQRKVYDEISEIVKLGYKRATEEHEKYFFRKRKRPETKKTADNEKGNTQDKHDGSAAEENKP